MPNLDTVSKKTDCESFANFMCEVRKSRILRDHRVAFIVQTLCANAVDSSHKNKIGEGGTGKFLPVHKVSGCSDS